MLKVQEYLLSGKPLSSLSGDPYNLIIRESREYVLLKYNVLDSDFNESICNECRGLIFYKPGWRLVCYPFNKFWNFGEEFADELDEEELYVYQKIDGSLCKVWWNPYEECWVLSSNGTIFAEDTEINGINFFTLFEKCLTTYNLTWETFIADLNKDYTYMYEMATQENPVVIKYSGYHLYYLGQRNINTYQEEYIPDTRVENVKQYPLNNIDDIVEASFSLPEDEEGYVVRDKHFNRIKIKSPLYFLRHKMENNGKPNFLKHYLDDFGKELLTYLPHYADGIKEIHNTFFKVKNEAEYWKKDFSLYWGLPRRDYAARAKIVHMPYYFGPFIFRIYENHNLTWEDYTADWDYNKWNNFLKRLER